MEARKRVPKTDPKPADLSRWRAAHGDALRLAKRMQQAATVFRRYSGVLKYHPQTGVEGAVGPDLEQAATTVREALTAISALASRWDEEITWLRSLDPALPVDDIQRSHAATREAIRLLRASLEVFERVVKMPEAATLDAPYGAGAPRRVHPGAQCTWVAERADGLARELSNVTLRKVNLLLAMTRPKGIPASD